MESTHVEKLDRKQKKGKPSIAENDEKAISSTISTYEVNFDP